MWKLLGKIIVFSLPFGLLFIFPAVLAVRSGEMISLASLVKAQRDYSHLILYDPLFATPNKVLKRLTILDRNPEILTVGTSRMQEFRSQFFNPGVRFYNGAYVVAGFDDYQELLHLFPPDHRPRILIVGLDYLNFDPARRSLVPGFSPYDDRTPLGNMIRGDWRKLYGYVFSGKITLQDIKNLFTPGDVSYLGLKANFDKVGFRNDGSYRRGDILDNKEIWLAKQAGAEAIVNNIGEGKGSFEFGESVSQEAIIELKQFLEEARADNIFVIGFLPPFQHKIYAKIESLPTDNPYRKSLEGIPRTLSQVFADYQFDFYNSADSAAYGGSDAEMMDENHASNKLTLRLFIQMAEHSPVLAPYTDVKYLKSKLESAKGDLEVFGNELCVESIFSQLPARCGKVDSLNDR